MAKKPIFSNTVKRQTMAEQVAETVQESILAGELESGATLPTEPELAGQFGVSRAVIRDATRILMARGLVEVQHGRGVFVTQPQNEAFGEALFLALRRAEATAWDIEQFDQIIYPEVVALAAITASDKEVANIRRLSEENLKVVAEFHSKWWQQDAPVADNERLLAAFGRFMRAIFEATHNQVFIQLAEPLLNLRALRNWVDAEDDTFESIMERATTYNQFIVEAVAGRDPDKARVTIKWIMTLPPEAITAMRQTPIGEIAVIPVSLPRYER
jgi:GntR family transcriptional repressor for pyruvate dehydrogenase complex